MVEGIPAFFAASRYGVALLVLMAVVFAARTIITYVALCIIRRRGCNVSGWGCLNATAR
jgi:hypothetical protein